jgi:hypothetical protein
MTNLDFAIKYITRSHLDEILKINKWDMKDGVPVLTFDDPSSPSFRRTLSKATLIFMDANHRDKLRD